MCVCACVCVLLNKTNNYHFFKRVASIFQYVFMSLALTASKLKMYLLNVMVCILTDTADPQEL